MKKRKITVLFIALTWVLLMPVLAGSTRERVRYNFNSAWLLKTGDITDAQLPGFDDSGWEKLTLPRAFNEDEAFRVHIEQLTDTVVWYRKHFRMPSADRGKKVFVEFEGARFGAAVYINGHYAGLHQNGVMAFGFDLSDFVDFDGDNVIAVRVDNSWDYRERPGNSTFQWNNKNFNANYGGLPKNVFLHVTGKLYQTLPLYSTLQTTGTYIYADRFDIAKRKAVIHAEAEVKNETDTNQTAFLNVLVFDRDSNRIAAYRGAQVMIEKGSVAVLKAEQEVTNLHFWSWGYGYLYNIVTQVVVNGVVKDELETTTGFRKLEFTDGMIKLNDRVIQIKGYAQRTSNEWPGVGMSVAPWLSDYSNGLMVESNANMVRWMHVTPWKQDVESCDRVGLMQMMPAGDAEADVQGRRWEQRVELMRDAIVYNRNNPSVVLYECGNESISEQHMAEMKLLRDMYDPDGGRAIGSREMLDSKIAEYGGEMLYINKSARIPMIATEYCRDEALRKYQDDFTPPYHKDGDGPLYRNAPANEYNRNQDSFAKEEIIRWNDYFVCRPGTGKRVSSGGLNIVFSDTNTHCRGAENYRRSGETDAMRILKDAYMAHQVMWDGWVDIENFHTYIIGHWNYAPGTVKDIMVVSPSDKVELFLNGKSLGFGEKTYNFLHTFRAVTFQAGELKAVSYAGVKKRGDKPKAASFDIRKTTGRPVAIKLTLIDRPYPVKADGADMVLLQVEVVDSNGLRCPDVHPLIHFDLTGPADWRGGIGQGPGNCVLGKTLPAECGVNRAIIRTTNTAGKITVKATSEGLISREISFTTTPFPVNYGLTTVLASNGLKGRLTRGETPAPPSFKPCKVPVEIAGVSAGANQDKALQSIDDNELSEWSNDGKISTAWICYTLKKKSPVSEVSLKLAGWRSVSYPVEVLVDDKLVWQGKTQQSLGYVYLSFPPVSGSSVTIRLTGANTEKDAFQNMVELNGKKESDNLPETRSSKNKGSLRIVEADITSRVSN